MADDLEKAFRKFSAKEQGIILALYKKIFARNLHGLQVKSLVGIGNYYRVRKGRIRIIYRDDGVSEPKIIRIANRDEKTYKGL